MKSVMKIGCIAFFIMLFGSLRNPVAAQDYNDNNITYQNFYDELNPYGQWIDYPQYGYVWSPRVQDFRPYSTDGHWVWTDDYQWMWASDYDWGWATFHYGRWLHDDWYGWVWVPGYEWSPAWVQWRTGGDYYGWAPLGPGVNVNINFGRYSAPDDYWNFVPRQYIISPRLHDYCLPYSRNITIINNTTIIDNYGHRNNIFTTGPDRYEVERYSHERINPYRFRETNRPGRNSFSGNTIDVYRPNVQRNENRNYIPRTFDRYEKHDGSNFQKDREILANEQRQRETPQRNTDVQNNNGIYERRRQVDQNRTIDQPQNNNGNIDRNRRTWNQQRTTEPQQENNNRLPEQRRVDEQKKIIDQQQDQNRNFDAERRQKQQEQNQNFERQRQLQDQQQNQNRNFDTERRQRQQEQNQNFERQRQLQDQQQKNTDQQQNNNNNSFRNRQQNTQPQNNNDNNRFGRRRNG
jgi:hypothetical protein